MSTEPSNPNPFASDAQHDVPPPPATPPRNQWDVRPVMPTPTPANTLGTVAFVLSLCGICTCGLTSLIGLICGIIALRRQPRGLAIAAIVVSIVGGCLVVPILGALTLPALARARFAARGAQTTMAAHTVILRADEFRIDHEKYPADAVECFGDEIPPFDAWGTPLKLVVEIDGDESLLFVWSAGEDGEWDTEDDFVAACSPPNAAKEKGYTENWDSDRMPELIPDQE